MLTQGLESFDKISHCRVIDGEFHLRDVQLGEVMSWHGKISLVVRRMITIPCSAAQAQRAIALQISGPHPS
jgi:hypothetical protein